MSRKVNLGKIIPQKGVDYFDGKDGVDGISSEVSIKTNTETEYVLTITDKNGSFDTPNLKGTNAENGILSETDPIYLSEKSNLALKTEIPTKTSELVNDSAFATESFVANKIAEAELSGGDVDLSGYATKDELNKKANTEDIPTKVSELDNDSGFITDYEEKDPTVPTHVKAIKSTDIDNWNGKSNFSGKYDDLEGKPTIPSIEGLATSEELTQGLATKQDVLTAGNNITIENGVISASGSGEGGLAELPIATSEVLGGIKVGEGLEITEDGVLSALGGGSSYKEVELLNAPVDYSFTTATSTSTGVNLINQDLSLSGNVDDYDEIIIKACKYYNVTSMLLCVTELRFTTSNIIYNNSNDRSIVDGSYHPWNLSSPTLGFACHTWFKNQNTIHVYSTETTLVDNNASDHFFRIMSIKGIKY